MVACGVSVGENVGGEDVAEADDGNEGLDGVSPCGANEKGLTCSYQAQTRNHEALLLAVESGEADGVRTSYVVAVVCDDHWSFHLVCQLSLKALPLLDYLSLRVFSPTFLVAKQNSDLIGFGFAVTHVHSGHP